MGLQFDAVLLDQMSGPLKDIADAFLNLNEVASNVSKGIAEGFKSAESSVVSFADVFSGIGRDVVSVNDAVMTFNDEGVNNLVQGMTRAVQATKDFLDASTGVAGALDGEDQAISGLFTRFSDLIGVKQDAAAAERTVAEASMGASGALGAEASASANASINLNLEKDAGLAGQPNREGGYGAILGATMLLGMAGAAARLGQDMIMGGMQAEAALNHVTALADTSLQNVQSYEEGLKNMAVETGKTVSDLASGLYDVASAGFKGTDGLTVLNAAAKAAAAGGADLHDVTNGLSSILIAYGINAQGASQATDILMRGVTDGKSQFSDFSRAIGLVGDAAKNAGISFQDSSAGLATLSLVFPSVRQAGADLQNLFNQFGPNLDNLAKRAQKLGLSFDEAKFKTMDLHDKLVYLQDITHGNTGEIEKITGGLVDMKAYLALTADNMTNFNRISGDMTNATGTVDGAFSTFSQSLEFKAQQVGAAMSVLQLDIAEIAKPVVTAALELVTNLFSAFATFVEQHANIAGPLLAGLAVIIGSLLVGAIIALNVALGELMAPAIAIAAPFIAAGVAIGGVVAFFVAGYQNSQPFRDALKNLGDAMGNLWKAVQPLADILINTLTGGLKTVAQWLFGVQDNTGKAGKAASDNKGFFGDLATVINNVADALNRVANWFSPFVGTVQDLGQKVQGLQQKFLDFQGQLDNGQRPMTDAQAKAANAAHAHKQLGGVMDGLKGAFQSFGPLAAGSAVSLGLLATHGTETRVAMSELGGHIVSIAKNAFPWLLEQMAKGPDVISTVMGWFGNFGEILGDFSMWLQNPLDLFQIFIDIMWRVGMILINPIDALGALGGAIGAAAAAAAPFVAIALVIAGVIAGLVMAFKHFWDTSAAFRAALQELWSQFQNLGTILKNQIHPILQALNDLVQKQLVPIWQNSLLPTFNAIKPALIAIGAIVGGTVLVVLGLLVGIFRGLFQAIGPVVVGLIQGLGGAFRIIAGVIQVVVTIVGGFITLIIDMFRSHDKMKKDALNIWNSLKDGIGNILGGIGQMIGGLFGGLWNGVVNFVKGFVDGVIGFFHHLWDVLLGHSIVPDIIFGIISFFTGLPVQVLKAVAGLIAGLINFFAGLEIQALAKVGQMILGIVQFFLGLGDKIMGALKNIPILGFFAGMAQGAIQQISGMVKGVSGLLDNLVNDSKNKHEQMALQASIKNTEMKVNAITTKETEVKAVIASEEAKKQGLIKKFQETKDPIEKARLAHQIQMINYQEEEQKQVLQKMENQKQQAIRKKNEEKAELERLQEEAKKNIVQKIGDMVMQGLGKLGDMASGAIKHISDFIGNIVSGIVGGVAGVANAIQQVVNNITSAITGVVTNALSWGGNIVKSIADGITKGIPNAIGGALGGLGNFIKDHMPASPAKLGPMRDIMSWGPNITRSIGRGMEAGIPHISESMEKVGVAVKNGLPGATGGIIASGYTGGVNLGGVGGVGPGGAAQIKEFHFHADGGLGAGLQLLNPTDRARLIRQISDEMAKQMQMQGRVSNGYSGY